MRTGRTLREWVALVWKWIGDRQFSAARALIVLGLVAAVVLVIVLINHFHAVPASRTTFTTPH